MSRHTSSAAEALILFLMLAGPVYREGSGGEAGIEAVLQREMDLTREQSEGGTASDEQLARTYGAELLPALEKYRNDVSPRVRWRAYALLWFVGTQSREAEVRRQVVAKLIEGAKDEESVIWGATSRWLLSFTAVDFSDLSKEELKQRLATARGRRLEYLILVVGVADITSELDRLGALVESEEASRGQACLPAWEGSVGWAALKARARMGVQEDIEHCIQMVAGVGEVQQRLSRFLPDLRYVRQPEVVTYLRTYLQSDEELPPMQPRDPAKKRTKGIGYSQFAVEALAEMLSDFPVKDDNVGGYSQEDIERCRRWMEGRTSFDIVR